MGLGFLPKAPSPLDLVKGYAKAGAKTYNYLNGKPRTARIGGKDYPVVNAEVEWGPGGNAKFLKDLARLRQSGNINTILGKTGLSLRSIHGDAYHPDDRILNFVGQPKSVSSIKRDLFLDPGEKTHLLQLVSNDLRHAPPGTLHPEQLRGSFVTTSHPEYGSGTLQHGFIHEAYRGQGISGEALKTRVAQAAGHLGFNPAITGSLSNEAIAAYTSAIKRGIIKPAPELLDQIIRHNSGARGVSKQDADKLWDFADNMMAQVPRHTEGAIVRPVHPQQIAKAMEMIKAAHPSYGKMYKGRN